MFNHCFQSVCHCRMKLYVLVLLFLSFFTSSIFSETRDFNCVFDKWSDSSIDTNIFYSLTKRDKTYINSIGQIYEVSYEDNKLIALVSNNNFYVDVIIINKQNKKITKSKTLDDLVIVIKGNCDK